MLYMLIITDSELSYENHSEDFCIGIFRTEKQAEETARFYLKNVRGFCDFPCTYRIVGKELIDHPNHMMSDIVWTVQGWNQNENLDETDIIESPCFVTKEQADAELQVMKKQYQRMEWTVNRWKIGECNWREGFVRTNEL